MAGEWLLPSVATTLDPMGAEAAGNPDEEFQRILAEVGRLLPASTLEGARAPGDLAAGIPDRGMVRIPGTSEVQDLGAFQRSALRDFTRQHLGRDTRSTPMVEAGGQRFWVSPDGSVTPVAAVQTDLLRHDPVGPAGGLLDTAGAKQAARTVRGLTTAQLRSVSPTGTARATLRGVTPTVAPAVLAEAQQKAQALLAQKAQRMPPMLEQALLDAASALRPGMPAQAHFQAVVQRVAGERSAAERERLQQQFDLALKQAGFLERVEARKATAEARATAREDRATRERLREESARGQQVQDVLADAASLDAQAAKDPVLSPEQRRQITDEFLTKRWAALDPATQQEFERRAAQIGWISPAAAKRAETELGARGRAGTGTRPRAPTGITLTADVAAAKDAQRLQPARERRALDPAALRSSAREAISELGPPEEVLQRVERRFLSLVPRAQLIEFLTHTRTATEESAKPDALLSALDPRGELDGVVDRLASAGADAESRRRLRLGVLDLLIERATRESVAMAVRQGRR